MDKQFNVKDFLLLMVLTTVVLLLLGCGGSDEGGSTSSSNPPSSGSTRPAPDQGEEPVQLERLTLTAYPIKTKGTSEITLITGSEQSFLAVGEYSNGQSKVLTEELTVGDWQSSDTELGEFIQSGVLKGKASGVVTVSFSQGNLTSNSLEVTVTDATITDITITPSAVILAKGHHQPLTATATYSNGLSMNISDSVTWVSDDPSKATITSQTEHGLLNGVSVGSTTVTAIKEGITSQLVDVEVTNAVITGISVTPSVVNIAKGQHQALTANAIYSDDTSSDISESVTWVPVDNSTATVTSNGVLSGGKVGKTTLTAVKDNVTSNTVGVVVSDAVITSISVTPSAVTVARGQTQSLTANAIFSDNTSSDISSSVSWRPVDNHTATVTSNGVLSGGNVGITTLTAVKDGVASNTVDVEVSDAVITSISVTPPIVTLAKGQNQALKATATYSDNTSSDISDSVSWRPVDNSTATVTSNGVLSGGNVGTTTLTALKDGVDSNTVNVDVSNAVLTEITVNPSIINVAKGQEQPLTARARYSDGTSSDISHSVNWDPIDTSTVTVTANGVLTGSAAGHTTLTAMKDGITSNTVGVVVSDAVITSISVTPSAVTVAKGQHQTLTANAIYSNNTSSDISNSVTWRPADNHTATVTSNGVLSGGNVGITTLTAVKDGVASNTVDVEVSDAVITSISVTPPIVTLAKGQNQALKAIATYSDNTSSDISDSVTWSPVDSNTAIVTSSGVLSGSNAGKTTLTAVKDEVTSNTVDVEVTNAVITRISVTPSVVNIAKGQHQALTANAIYSDGTSSIISDSVVWRLDTNTATITSNGVLSGDDIGTTTLTATKDGITSLPVGVVVSEAELVSISVTPPMVTVARGQHQALTATAIYSDNTSSDISNYVTWNTIEPSTATVVPGGKVTGVNVGTTSLTAVKNGITSNRVSVDVSNAVVTGISVTPSVISIAKGQTQTLTANAIYSDNTSSDISDSVTWIPSDTSIAVVTENGVLSGSNAGATSLTALKDGVTSHSVSVEVSDAVLTSIDVTPSVVNVAKGQNQTLTATATYSDNTFSDVSESVTWIPIDTSIAAVTAKGVLSGSNIGTTTLTAVKGSITSQPVDVAVSDAVLTAINVTPTELTVAKGHSQPLIATATYSDNTSADISDSVTWIPVDTTTAIVTPQGQVTGVGVGTTSVTARKGNITSNTSDVVITDAIMTELTLTPPAVGLMLNATQQMKASAIYSDGTSYDVSDSVTWWAPIGADEISLTDDGLVTGVKTGSSGVTATYNGFSHSVEANVCNISNLTGKCIYTLNVGNKDLLTNTPSIAYLDSLSLGGSAHSNGTNGEFYVFKWRQADAICAKYNEFKLAGRTNWRLPTLNELIDNNDKNRIVRNWYHKKNHWTSSGGGSWWDGYKNEENQHRWASYHGDSFSFFAPCFSEYTL
ncbi:Ig-like domain-containing protein [Vibrio neptunius]|uniref:Ig-like domain-containing protein n=1 Tax=Vibrio neptunius TaxID=170651 RepID=UPI000697D0B3|nr:Ig-like domain-containing protein [Vibrio neptunius]